MKRKLINLWRVATRRYLNPETNLKMEVIAVNIPITDEDKDNTSLADYFGITDDRLAEIEQSIIDLPKGTPLAETIITMSKACKHPNELAMICFITGQSYEQMRNPIVKFLGSFGMPPQDNR